MTRGKREKGPAGAFLTGVFAAQIANNALHIAQPLLVMELTGSFGKAALFTAFDTSVHMAGTALGGWPADRFGSRRLLIASTLLRAASLALIPLALSGGKLTMAFAAFAYTLDAFVRGFFDTAVHALPLELARDSEGRDRLNAGYELAFDAGGVVGPALLGLAFAKASGVLPHALVPAGFAAAALIFTAIPLTAPVEHKTERARRRGTLEGLKAVAADRRLLVATLGLSIFNLYPLRKLVSAFFGKALLGSKAAAGPVGAAFGLGGALGAALYGARADALPTSGWIAAGALGTIALAAGWIPASLALMTAACLAFSLVNVCARLALTRRVQEKTPLELAGGVTAVARAGSNAASVLLKAAVGLAFTWGAGPREAFGILGAGLAILGLAQFFFAGRERGPMRPDAPAYRPTVSHTV